MKTVTVVEVNDIATLPPTQNLVRVLLSLGFRVNLIGNNLACLTADIHDHCHYQGFELPRLVGKTFMSRQIHKVRIHFAAIKFIRAYMEDSDYLWTTSMETIAAVGKEVVKYKNIMQLLELAECARTVHNLIKIPLDNIAKRSWKVVTVEINRAYIQKIWWNLSKTPFVLPNKPFSLEYGEVPPELNVAINRMKSEKKKIIYYLGVICSDRDFINFAKNIQKSDDYVFYFAGRIVSSDSKKVVETLEKKYGAVYLGMFNPPTHLALLQYAYIGLLPYKPVKMLPYSELNALYCAPNKIWEYAGFGVPMVGSDVLGLRLPFEQWNIGCCCDVNDEDSIRQAIDYVDAHHEEMSQNCYKFYDSVDLNKIVAEILEDDE